MLLPRIFCALTSGSEVFKDFSVAVRTQNGQILIRLANFRCFKMDCQQIYTRNSNECLYNHSFAVVLSRLSCQQIAVPLCHWFINRYWSSGILTGPESLLINVRSISALSFRFGWTLLDSIKNIPYFGLATMHMTNCTVVLLPTSQTCLQLQAACSLFKVLRLK